MESEKVMIKQTNKQTNKKSSKANSSQSSYIIIFYFLVRSGEGPQRAADHVSRPVHQSVRGAISFSSAGFRPPAGARLAVSPAPSCP